jgi:hypothetical protein
MRFVFVLVAIGLATLSPAYAQSANWQKYQPQDAGFSIEMPGKPQLKTEQKNGQPTYSALVAFDKSAAGNDLVFLVKYRATSKSSGSENDAILDLVVKSMAEGGKLRFTKKEALAGFPGRRFAIEDADKDTMEIRAVITDRYFIQALFLGPVDNPLGKRFLDSFAVEKR